MACAGPGSDCSQLSFATGFGGGGSAARCTDAYDACPCHRAISALNAAPPTRGRPSTASAMFTTLPTATSSEGTGPSVGIVGTDQRKSFS